MNNYFTKAKRSNFFAEGYSALEWLCVKISLVTALCVFLFYILFNRYEQPFAQGVCTWVNCAALTHGYVRVAVVVGLLLAAVLYIMEVGVMYITLLLFAVAVVLLSLDESNGNTGENGVLSLVFFSQFVAYFFYRLNAGSDLAKNRMQFMAQIFAAAYMLSGISKLHVSGMAWFTTDAPKFALEVLRVFHSQYITYGNPWYDERGMTIANFVLSHPLLIQILLGLSLLLELCAFVLMLNKRWAFYYACLLLALHLGIYLSLGIFFPTIMLPMAILFINPLYWVLCFAQWIFHRFLTVTTVSL